MIWLFIAVALVAAGVIFWLGRRRPPYEPGVHSFQRHIDALSSERRRESFDRVRPPAGDDNNGTGR